MTRSTRSALKIALLLALPAAAQPPGQRPAPVRPPRLAVQLYAAHTSVQPGGRTELAVELKIESGWHIYDPIILDSGAPTTIAFAAPPGVQFGELRFPAPTLGRDHDLEYLALDERAVVLTTITVPADTAGPLELRADVRALACKELCFPVQATARLVLPVDTAAPAPANETLFKEARAALPRPLAEAPYLEGSGVTVVPDRLSPDAPAEIVFSIKVKSGHHIQDQDPGNEALIPSRVFVEPLDGLKLGEPIWPAAHVVDTKAFGKVREQRGEFKVRVPVSIIDSEFASGPVELRVLFTYQCCSDKGMCFPPETAGGSVRFVAQTPNPPPADGRPQGSLVPRVTQGEAAAGPGDRVTVEGAAPAAPHSPAPPAGGPDASGFVIPPLTAADWEHDIPWQPWKPGYAEWLAEQGQRVYVDYTAKWCLTCQANKKAVLETEGVRRKMQELGVIPILADFSNRDPRMHAEILKHGAPTVPVNVVFAPHHPETPAVLPTVLTTGEVLKALSNPLAYRLPTEQTLWLALLGGFLGGLILNVMPCVLPVISIKVLSFVQQAGENRGRILRLGLAFSAGIMAWFWVFAFLSTRGQIPWQYPQVVIGLGSLLFVFSLNLFGIFEFTLPGAAAGTLDSLGTREGYGGAFLKGLLATLLGTACTAPFMAGAFAYALTQPAWTVFLVFTSAGVGMALPYLLLSAQPAWLRFVPRPGAWMVTFKQATGFVLLGTVVWLLWILAAQLDGLGIVWTVAFWGFLALAVWMLGQIRHTWAARHRLAMWLASVAVAALGWWFCFFVMYDWRPTSPAEPAAPAAVARDAPLAAGH